VTADLTAAAQALRLQGHVEAAVVTAGAHGAAFASPQGSGVVPAFQVQAVDTTAAGDTFVGGLVAALADGLDLRPSIAFASAAAAIAVTREGAQPSIPSRTEVEQFKARGADASRPPYAQ
jgi:ribokinase